MKSIHFLIALTLGLITVATVDAQQRYRVNYYPTYNTPAVSQSSNFGSTTTIDSFRDRFTYSQTGLTRKQIEAMPLLSRPNRIGHFYGNTARRRYARRGR